QCCQQPVELSEPSSIAACRLAVVKRAYYLSGEIHHEPFHPIPGRNPGMAEWSAGFRASSGQRASIFSFTEKKLKDIKLMHIHTEGPAKYNEPEYEGIFRQQFIFHVFELPASGHPRRQSRLHAHLFCPEQIPLLVLGATTSSWDMALIMRESEVAAHPRRTPTISLFPPRLTASFTCRENLQEMPARQHAMKQRSPSAKPKIAQNLLSRIAVLAELGSHKDLGVHSEMFSDGIVGSNAKLAPIHECLERKYKHPEKIVSGFVIGSNKVFNFINDNPFVELCDIQFTNRTAIICPESAKKIARRPQQEQRHRLLRALLAEEQLESFSDSDWVPVNRCVC
uniref:HTH OST-type domain-containing protein n=1 Tax=Macrostomum lignano TaxID=282301 RepID=A0A1I8FFK6_9PLAT